MGLGSGLLEVLGFLYYKYAQQHNDTKELVGYLGLGLRVIEVLNFCDY